MGNRPLRDIPPSINYQGQAARAWGRIDKGLESLERGNTAIKRGLEMVATVAAERAEQLYRLEEELTGARAETEFRRRFGELLRQLDPNAQDYTERVQALFNETASAISKEFQFRGQAARDRFNVRLENLRTQATLQALDARERAVVERAELEINQRLNQAAAAVTNNPGAFSIIFPQFEAEIAGLVANLDANRRDRILQAARERLATEYVRTLISNRQFRQSEEALRTLGEQGLLSSTAVGAIRAALTAERRQAEAEARQARAEAYQNAMLAIQEAQLVIEQGGSVLDRQRAVEAAEKAAADAARMFGTDSPQARRLNLALQRLSYQARDRGSEVLEAFRIRMWNGDSLNEREQAQWIAASQARAADEAERMLPSDAPPELRAQVRAEAAQAARARAITELIQLQPGGRIPVLEAELERARRQGPEAFAAAVADIAARGYGQVPAVTDTINRDPVAFAIMQRLLADGRPITRDSVLAVMAALPQVSPEIREARQTAFDQEFVRPPRQGADPPGWAKATTALRAADRNFPITNADRQAVLEAARRLAASGYAPEEAFRLAAEQHIRLSASRITAATADGRAAENVPLRRELDPIHRVPGEIANLYGLDNVRRALAERGAALVRDYNARLPAERRIPEHELSKVTVVPVLRDGQISYLLVTNFGNRTISALLTDENDQVVVDAPSPDFYHETLGLRQMLEQERRARNRAPVTRQELQEWAAPPRVSPTEAARRGRAAAALAASAAERWAEAFSRGEIPEGVTWQDVSHFLFGDPEKRPTREEFRQKMREALLTDLRRGIGPPSNSIINSLYDRLFGEKK